MPFKQRIVKTYGRHKFRTVKSNVWANSPAICSSGNESSDFESPAIRRPLAMSTNIPRAQWSFPNPNANRIVDKENVVASSSSSSSSSNSPCSIHRRHCAQFVPETPPWALCTHDQNKQSSPGINCSSIAYVPISKNSCPETSLSQRCSSSIDSPVFVFNEKNPNPITESSRTFSVEISPVSVLNLSPKHDNSRCSSSSSVFIHSSTPAETSSEAIQSSTANNESVSQNCSMSTPVIRANSRNSHFVTVRGRGALSKLRGNQKLSISDCQILVEQLKLTPEQYGNTHVLSSFNERDPSFGGVESKNMSHSLNNRYMSHEESGRDSLFSNTLLTKAENSKRDSSREGANKMSSDSFSSYHSDLVSECVVSLEKLRLSPFKVNGRLDQKRLCVRVSLDSTSISPSCPISSICEDYGQDPSSPPRHQSSHISSLDVLTPSQLPANELSAFNKLLLECDQEKPLTFKEYFKPRSVKKCAKIGEGVYGEVFRTINDYKQEVALKIIPIDGTFHVNGEPQKTCQEILHEIVISKELSELAYCKEKEAKWSTPNFINVHRVSVVQDRYPSQLIKEWVKWDKKNNSENDKPDIFPKDQLFLIFEFANGGQDLESFGFRSMTEALSVLQQVTLSLAIAEASLEFEHRDLHWGNVLIIRNNNQKIQYTLDGETKVIDSCGVHVSIIDFTLSRLRKDGVTVFCNLSKDESLFTGQGDYQFDIYRQMKAINGDDWEAFTPTTNIFWLHYLTDKILKKNFPSHDRTISLTLRKFFNRVTSFQSAREFTEFDENGLINI